MANIRVDTRRTGAGRLIVIRYIPPEWIDVVRDLRRIVMPVSWGASVYFALAAMWDHPIDLSAFGGPSVLSHGEWLVAAGAVAMMLYWLVSEGVDWVHGFAVHSHALGGKRLKMVFSDEDVVVFYKGAPFVMYRSDGDIRITADQHRKGVAEGREQERLNRHESAKILLPFTYRDAFEIWIQQGEILLPVAAVADQYSAAAVVRALQEADASARQGRDGVANTVEGDPYGEERAL